MTNYQPQLFDIVLTEWREQYDREEGLGIVTSVPNDGMCWVCKIEKDDEGMFVIPNAMIRSIKLLKPTHHKLVDMSIKTEHQAIITQS